MQVVWLFAADSNHHQHEARDKCILCCDKHHLENCKEYMKKIIEDWSKFFARKKLWYGSCKPISLSNNVRTCNDKRVCQICKKKHPTSLHGYTLKQEARDGNSSASYGTQENVTLKSNYAKFHDVSYSASYSDDIASKCILPVKTRSVAVHHAVMTFAVSVLFLLW